MIWWRNQKRHKRRKTKKISPKEVVEKDSEETVSLQDAEETATDKEQITHQKEPNFQNCKAQSSSKFSQNEIFQEIISISSDSETETKS